MDTPQIPDTPSQKPLEKQEAEKVITLLQSMSVEQKLEGIKASRILHQQIFGERLTMPDWAFGAYVLETCYNLVRNELRIAQRRLREVPEISEAPVKKKAAPKSVEKKPNKYVMSLDKLEQAFAKLEQKKAGQK